MSERFEGSPLGATVVIGLLSSRSRSGWSWRSVLYQTSAPAVWLPSASSGFSGEWDRRGEGGGLQNRV